jgi:regulation of enolase protein 1 (concanavalin A-like superfamily)
MAYLGKGIVMYVRNAWCRLWTGFALAIWMSLVSGQPAGACDTRAAEEKRPSEADQFSMYDGFDGKLALKWEPVRHDPTHVSLIRHPGKLTITTQRGTIHGNEKADALSEGTQAKNLYLIRNPASEGSDFVMTTRIESFAPTAYWQQAGLMIYDDDDNYVKCDLEWNRQAPSEVVPVLLRETDQQSDFFSVRPEEESETYWLRVTKRGKLYRYAYSTDGENYAVVGEKPWGNGAPKWVGIYAKNGGNPRAADIDAQFDFFEIRSLTDAEKNDPVYLEQRKLHGTWEVVSFRMSGKAVDDTPLSRFAFDDGQLTINERTETLKTEYTLDVAKKPKELVLSAFFS